MSNGLSGVPAPGGVMAVAGTPYPPSCGQGRPQDVIEALLRRLNPEVIAFGEEEYQGSGNPVSSPRNTVTIWFARRVLPLLFAHGFHDIVVEFLPDDPQLQTEIELFQRTGRLSPEETPRLDQVTRMQDEPGIRILLEEAHRNGIRVHGGRGTWRDWETSGLIQDDVIRRSAEAVRRTTLEKVRTLRSQGKKVITWNGFLHNDPSPFPENEFASFGPDLVRELPAGRYLAVDIFFKGTIRRDPDFRPGTNAIPPRLARWLRTAARLNPLQLQCLRLLPNSYVLLLPGTAH